MTLFTCLPLSLLSYREVRARFGLLRCDMEMRLWPGVSFLSARGLRVDAHMHARRGPMPRWASMVGSLRIRMRSNVEGGFAARMDSAERSGGAGLVVRNIPLGDAVLQAFCNPPRLVVGAGSFSRWGGLYLCWAMYRYYVPSRCSSAVAAAAPLVSVELELGRVGFEERREQIASTGNGAAVTGVGLGFWERARGCEGTEGIRGKRPESWEDGDEVDAPTLKPEGINQRVKCVKVLFELSFGL